MSLAPGYRGLLANRELVALLVARLVSLVGDQLARVALSVLVFTRTGSTAMSALAYACTYLPALVAGPLLGGLADRQPRRRVLVTGELVRAGLFALMALPGTPLGVLLLLVLLQTAVEAPCQAARGALVRDVTDEATSQRGTGLDEALDAVGQVCAFAGAGALLVVVRPGTALLLDVVTFLLSAGLILLLVRPRPAASQVVAEPAPVRGGRRAALRAARRAERLAAQGGRLRRGLEDSGTGWRAALAPACRRPVLITWACLTATIVPEAVAAPWAESLGAGPVVVGLLFAASPAGSLAAVLLLGGVSRATGRRLLVPLAALSLLPLLLCLARPGVTLALVLVTVSGVGTGFSLLGRVQFVEQVADAERGRAFAVASTGVNVAQGLGIGAASALAVVLPPAAVVGSMGALGLVLLGLALLVSPASSEPTAAVPVRVPEQRRATAPAAVGRAA